MKRYIFFKIVRITCIILLLLQTKTYAQRALPGQQSIELTAGTVNGFNANTKSMDFAFHAGVFFSVYGKSADYWRFGAEYLQKKFPYKNISIPTAQFTGEAGRFFNTLSNRNKTLFCSVGISAMAGYESINWGNKLLFDGATIQNKDVFVYGAAVTFEPQLFLSDRVALLLNVRERMLQNASSKFNTQFGAGIKIQL